LQVKYRIFFRSLLSFRLLLFVDEADAFLRKRNQVTTTFYHVFYATAKEKNEQIKTPSALRRNNLKTQQSPLIFGFVFGKNSVTEIS